MTQHTFQGLSSVNTNLKSCVSDLGIEYIVVYGNPLVGLGDLVNYRKNHRLVDQRYVSYRHSTKLSTITEEQLEMLHPSYGTKELLWEHLEKELGEVLPGSYEVTILGVCTEPYFSKELVDDTPIEHTTREFFDIADEYEEDFGDYNTRERVKKKSQSHD